MEIIAAILLFVFLLWVLFQSRPRTEEKDALPDEKESPPKVIHETAEQYEARMKSMDEARRRAKRFGPSDLYWFIKPPSNKPLRLGPHYDYHFRKNLKKKQKFGVEGMVDESWYSYEGKTIQNLRYATIENWGNKTPGPGTLLPGALLNDFGNTPEDGAKYEEVVFACLWEQLQKARIKEKALIIRKVVIHFEDARGKGTAKPDILMIVEKKFETPRGPKPMAIIFESKLTYTPSAWRQLKELYGPLIADVYKGFMIIGVQVFLNRGYYTGPAFSKDKEFIRNLGTIAMNAKSSPSVSLYAWHLHRVV